MLQQVETAKNAVADADVFRKRTSQVVRATQGLRQMLLRGEFQPGERIVEVPLALKLSVSRSPLRIAFEKLEHEGLIKRHPRSGFCAGEFSIDDIWDAIETRAILEGASARLAAKRLTHTSRLEPLRRIHHAAGETSTSDMEIFIQRQLDLNKAFHAGVLDLADNQSLRREVEWIWKFPFTSPSALVLLYDKRPEAKTIIPIAREHHRAIIEAIEQRDGRRAEDLAREHCGLARRNLELAMGDTSILKTMPGGSLLAFPD